LTTRKRSILLRDEPKTGREFDAVEVLYAEWKRRQS